jgi:hypothetical protein
MVKVNVAVPETEAANPKKGRTATGLNAMASIDKELPIPQ